MKFGIFYEHQLPRPWGKHSEYQLLQDSLTQIELADKLGYDYAWEVEHHFLEEYILNCSKHLHNLTKVLYWSNLHQRE